MARCLALFAATAACFAAAPGVAIASGDDHASTSFTVHTPEEILGGKKFRILAAKFEGADSKAVGADQKKWMREIKEKTAGTGIDVAKAKNGIKVIIPAALLFEGDVWSISPKGIPTLNTLAGLLGSYPNILIDISGFADTTASGMYNYAREYGLGLYNFTLSYHRAKAMQTYLSTKGAPATAMAFQGYGDDASYFRDKGRTDKARAENSRMEIRIIPITQAEVAQAKGS